MLAVACLGHQLPVRRAAPTPRHSRVALIHEHTTLLLLADLDMPDPAEAGAAAAAAADAAAAAAADLDAGLKQTIGQLKAFDGVEYDVMNPPPELARANDAWDSILKRDVGDFFG